MTTADVAQINRRLDALSQTVTRLDEAIRGNGRDGIRQEMTGLSAVQESHAEAIRSLRSTRKRAAWELIRFGGGVLLGVVVYAVTTHLGGH